MFETTIFCCCKLLSFENSFTLCSADILPEPVHYHPHSIHRLFFKDFTTSLTKLFTNVGYGTPSRSGLLTSSRQGMYSHMKCTADQGIQQFVHGNWERAEVGGAMNIPESYPNMKSRPSGYQCLDLL